MIFDNVLKERKEGLSATERLNLITSKTKEYHKYIKDHISDVKKAFESMISDNVLEGFVDSMELNILYADIVSHDASKWSYEEFDGYRKYFYPIDDSEKDEDEFNRAWEHHYTNNSHHWEFWYDNNSKRFKSGGKKLAYIHMIADWLGMSYKFGGTPWEFYNKNLGKGDDIKIDPKCISMVETILKRVSGIEDIEL